MFSGEVPFKTPFGAEPVASIEDSYINDLKRVLQTRKGMVKMTEPESAMLDPYKKSPLVPSNNASFGGRTPRSPMSPSLLAMGLEGSPITPRTNDGSRKVTDIHFSLRMAGVDPSGDEQQGFLCIPVSFRRQVKNSIIALRSVKAIQHALIGVPSLALADTKDEVVVIVNVNDIPYRTEPLEWTDPKAAVALHILARELNLIFEPSQVPVLQMLMPPPESKDKVALHAPAPAVTIFDAAELMPPLFPVINTSYESFVLSRFRPEFVRDYAVPLCSTALYSNCPVGTRNEHKLNLLRANLHLVNVVIPTVAKLLDTEPFPLYGVDLCQRLHMFGVNLRYLGWLLPWMKSEEHTRGVITEIVARAYKYVEPDEEDESEGTEWSTLSRIAMNHFYPYHLHMPLPNFHSSSFYFLTRCHPRYGIDIDTLEATVREQPIANVDVTVQVDPRSIPPTPAYQEAYEFETVLVPEMVDSENLEARILELCHTKVKFLPLPGRWNKMTREYTILQSSHVATHYFNHLQDSLLNRSDALGVSCCRLLPLLRGLCTCAFSLYPFERSLKTDQSPALYAAHMLNVVNVDAVKEVLPKMAVMAPEWIADVHAETLGQVASFYFSGEEHNKAAEYCNQALQVVNDPRIKVGLLMLLAAVAETKGEDDQLIEVTTFAATLCQQIFPSNHADRAKIVTKSRKVSEKKNVSVGTKVFRKKMSMVTQGVQMSVLRCLREVLHDLLEEYNSTLFVSPLCYRLPTSLAPVDETPLDVMTIISYFLTTHHPQNSYNERRFNSLGTQAVEFLEHLKKLHALVLIGDCSKTSVLQQVAHCMISEQPFVNGGTSSDVVAVYIDARKHYPLDETFLLRAFEGLSAEQVQSIISNPRTLLLLDGIGEGPKGLSGLASSSQLFDWQGKMILTLKSSICTQLTPLQRFQVIFPDSVRAHYSPQNVELCEVMKFGERETQVMLSKFLHATMQQSAKPQIQHALDHVLPHIQSVIREPILLVNVLHVLLDVLNNNPECPWLRVVDILDGVVDSWITRHEKDPKVQQGAWMYAAGLSLRMHDETLFNLVNPAAKQFLHCLPIQYISSTEKTSFSCQFFRSYFMSVKLSLELMDVKLRANQFVTNVTKKVFPQLLPLLREDAMKKSSFGLQSTIMRGFTQNTAGAAALKAVGKFKTAKSLTGGEWLVNHSIASLTDPHLLELLADRVISCPAFQDSLWHLLNTRRDLPVLTSNICTILVRAGCSFSGRNLRNIVFSRSDLTGFFCCAADARNSVWRFARMYRGTLDQTELRGADWKSFDIGAKLQIVESKSGCFLCVTFAPVSSSAEVFVTGDEKGKIMFWDPDAAEPFKQANAGGAVCCLAFTEDGHHLASGSQSSDCLIKIWNCQLAHELILTCILQGHDNRISGLGFLSSTILISSSFDWSVRCWSVKSIMAAHSTTAAESSTSPMAPRGSSPKPTLLPSLQKSTMSPSPVKFLGRKTSPPPSQQLHHWHKNITVVNTSTVLAQHTSFITAFALSVEACLCATINAEGGIIVINARSGFKISSFQAMEGTRGVNSLVFSHDGTKLAIPFVRGLVLYNPQDGFVQQILPFPSGSDVSSAVAFSSDSSLIAAARNNYLAIWNVASSDIVHYKEAHKSRISGVAFNTQGSCALSCSWDGSVRISQLELSSKKEVASVKRDFRFLEVCCKGQRLITVSPDGIVDLWDAMTGIYQGTVLEANFQPSCAAADSQSDTCVVASTKIILFSILKKTRPKVLTSHIKPVSSVLFGPLGTSSSNALRLLISVGIDRAFRIWDAYTGALLYAETKDAPLYSLAAGVNTVFAVSGFLSTKQLMLQPFKITEYPSSITVPRQVSLSVSQEQKTVARNHLAIVLALKKKYGLTPQSTIRSIFPFLRKPVEIQLGPAVGPIKISVKEGQIRCVTAANDTVVALTVERAVYVWDIVRKIQIRSSHLHSHQIMGLSVIENPETAADSTLPANRRQILLASASLDATVLISRLMSGERLVIIQPSAGFHMHAVRFLNYNAVVTAGTDMMVRHYNLQGSGCQIGGKNEFASMTWNDMLLWLRHNGLSALVDPLQGMSSRDLIDMTQDKLTSLLVHQDPVLIEKLNSLLLSIKEQSYKTSTVPAIDDNTISVDTFRSFSYEKVVEWVESQGLQPMALLISIAKVKGEKLYEYGFNQMMLLGNVDYDTLVSTLHEEMVYVRSSKRDTFSEKSLEEIAQWAKIKHPMLQFALLISRFTGQQLLDHTNYPYKTTIYCTECQRTILDSASVCPKTGGDHGHIPALPDEETTGHVQRVAKVLRDHHREFCEELVQKLQSLPHGVFSHGVYWYDMIEEIGNLAVVSFHMPELSPGPNLVINNAYLTIFTTEPDAPRMVVITDEGENTLLSLAGLRNRTTRFFAAGMESPLPDPWERVQGKHDQVLYKCGQWKQSVHPCLPKVASLGISGNCLISTTRRETKAEIDAQRIVPPQPKHFFVQSQTNKYEYRADVSDQLLSLVKRGQKQLTLMIAAESIVDNTYCFAASRRPNLAINFYHSDQLCGCQSVIKSGTVLCDRFCNAETQCKGHQCSFSTPACRKAPYLVWQSVPATAGSFKNINLKHISNVSVINEVHIRKGEKDDAPSSIPSSHPLTPNAGTVLSTLADEIGASMNAPSA